MADNVAVTAGSGVTIAADEVVDGTLGTVKVQFVKLMDGTLDGTTKLKILAGSATVAATDPAIPVQIHPNSQNANGVTTPSGSTPTVEAISATGTLSNVASSATSVTLLASNASRLGATIYNDSTAILYVKLNSGAASATSYTVQVAANGYYEVPSRYSGAITGIWASANGNARVTEMT